MVIDTSFDVYTDAKGGDPDSKSPTLRYYHKLLWSKAVKAGYIFNLEQKSKIYLYHNSKLGEFFLGSDAITHSYKNHKRKSWLINQIPTEVDELLKIGSTIGAYIIFPNNKVDGKHTINQARGVNSFIDDRFDLTLECIKRFYLDQESPLYETLLRYNTFFKLFVDFNNYINFFFLDDLLDDNNNIKFYLPFNNFKNKPCFSGIEDYLLYKKVVSEFVKARNKRIQNFSKK